MNSTIRDDHRDKAQLAAYLGKSVRTIERMIEKRDCPAFVEVAGTKYFSEKAVAEWLHSKTVRPARARRRRAA